MPSLIARNYALARCPSTHQPHAQPHSHQCCYAINHDIAQFATAPRYEELMDLVCHCIETAIQQGKARHSARSPAAYIDAQCTIHQYTKDKISNNMSALAYKKRQDSRTYPWHSLLQMPNNHPTLPARDGGGLVGESEDNCHPKYRR